MSNKIAGDGAKQQQKYRIIPSWIADFNNISVISWRSVLLMEETRVTGENHRPVASHWQTLSHNAVSSTPRRVGFELINLVVVCILAIVFSVLRNLFTL
jgi:hypothetical protein